MSNKMKIPTIFRNKKDATKQPLWQWPSCNHPKTLSFRDDVFKTVNSVFLDPSDGLETPESWFTNSSECPSFSTDEHSDDHIYNNNDNSNASHEESLEMIIRAVRSSERIFFEVGETSSILNEAKTVSIVTNDHQDESLPFKGSVAIAFESEDPYLDFKTSMQEMVESHEMNDWDCLQELLGWYLQMNGKVNHGFIVGAFIDLLIGLSSYSDHSSSSNPPVQNQYSLATRSISCSESTSYSSADSSFSSPRSSILLDKEKDDVNIVQFV